MGMLKVDKKPKIICGEGKTKQSFKDKVNINSIIAKHRKGGMITHLNMKKPFYGDVSNIVGYQEALNKVKMAEELFNKMSSDIRKKFNNNPENMISYLSNPENKQEAIKLGMIKNDVVPPEPQPAEPPAPAEPPV